MGKGTSTNTVVQNSQPPQQFLNAYQNVNTQAQNVAATPYTPYPYQTVAQFTPDQANSFSQVEGLTANGGVQTPYLQAAQTDINNAATGINPQNFATTEAAYQSPYTQQVLGATEAAERNTDAQQQQQVASSAAQAGAYGGDREAVAQGITAGQQALANNQTNAGIEQAGFNQAVQTAEANQWLNSQAGAGEANLGSEAQSTGLQGASALLQTGGLEQQMGQENLNIPYEQYLAAQAYPFQTTGWEAGIAEGLGSAAGGTGTTTSPGPSATSQIAGLGLGGLGLAGALNSTGLGSSISSGLSSLFGGSAAGLTAADLASGIGAGAGAAGLGATAAGVAEGLATGAKSGGAIHRDAGGMIPASSTLPPGLSPNVPDVSIAVVPTSQQGRGGSGPPRAPQPYQEPSMQSQLQPLETGLRAYGQATKGYDSGGATDNSTPPWLAAIVQENLDNQVTSSLAAPQVAAPAPLTDMQQSDQTAMASGGMVPRQHFDMGGMSMSQATPWWTRDEEREATDRHGLLASPIAGRTDHIAISPASGSYVVPADVVSGLGEGNTLAGANVMQRMLETGPHGLTLNHERIGKGPPRPPPAYREGEGDNGMAAGGGLEGYAEGGGPDEPEPEGVEGDFSTVSNLPTGQRFMNWLHGHAPHAPPPSETAQPAGESWMDVPLGEQAIGWAKRQNWSPTSNAPPWGPGAVSSDAGPAPHGQAKAAPPGAPPPSAPNTFFQAFHGRPDETPVAGEPPISAEQRAHLVPVADHRPSGAMTAANEPVMSPPSEQRSHYPQGSPPATVLTETAEPGGGGMEPTGPPPGGMQPARAGTGEPSMHDPGFSRYTPREIEPSPWLALAQAGFGMAAGRSPHALENIGAGAERGVATYEQERQNAAQRNLQAEMTAAQREDTAAYRAGMLGNTANRNATYAGLSDARIGYYQAQADKLSAAGNGETFKWSGVDPNNGLPIYTGNRGTTKYGTLAEPGMTMGMTPSQQSAADTRNLTLAQRQQEFAEKQAEFRQREGREMTTAENAELLRQYQLSRDPQTGKTTMAPPQMRPFQHPALGGSMGGTGGTGAPPAPGLIAPPTVAAPTAPKTATPPTPRLPQFNNPAEVNLPPGSHFLDPNGVERVVPGP